MPRKKGTRKKRKVTEYFDIEKSGFAKSIKAEGTEIVDGKTDPREKEKQNKILMGVFATIIFLVAVLVVFFYVEGRMSHFVYKGVSFDTIKQNSLVFYKTGFPVIANGQNATYNFYIRNDPRNLERINFTGDIVFRSDMVLNISNDLNCNGDGVIAVANLVNMNIFRMNVFKNESMGCNPEGNYTFVNIRSANESSINEYSPGCYNLNVANCEILPVTEKFMVESFVKANEIIYSKPESSPGISSVK